MGVVDGDIGPQAELGVDPHEEAFELGYRADDHGVASQAIPQIAQGFLFRGIGQIGSRIPQDAIDAVQFDIAEGPVAEVPVEAFAQHGRQTGRIGLVVKGQNGDGQRPVVDFGGQLLVDHRPPREAAADGKEESRQDGHAQGRRNP